VCLHLPPKGGTTNSPPANEETTRMSNKKGLAKILFNPCSNRIPVGMTRAYSVRLPFPQAVLLIIAFVAGNKHHTPVPAMPVCV